jgi:hypothetical protein
MPEQGFIVICPCCGNFASFHLLISNHNAQVDLVNSEATSQIISLIVDRGEVDIVIATGRDSEGIPGRIFSATYGER